MSKYANCFDETGADICLTVPLDWTVDDINQAYPEYRFRFWQEYSVRELAEFRLGFDDDDNNWY